MIASIITIGDELLIGQVVDTNSAWMAQRLNDEGIELYQITSVHDNREHILAALDEAFSRVDIVLTTGGLGPTKDDITKNVLCEYYCTSLVEDPDVRTHIQELYKERPDVLNRLTSTQWLVPKSAKILPNRVGSAPIMVFERYGKRLIAMPGVPHEMKIAMLEQVLPYLKVERVKIIHRTLMLYGVAESTLALLLEDWEKNLPASMHLAYLPKDGVIRLRLSTYGEASESDIDAQMEILKCLVSDYLISTEDLPLEVILGKLLNVSQRTISTAESCTGGRLAAVLNSQSGSSSYYMGSVVAYDNCIKKHVLGVHPDTLEKYGAVSEQTVREMAQGVRALMHTDYAIATSGIAGPTGGSPDKPVGTVWVAWATPNGIITECFRFGVARERKQITQRAVTVALIRMIKIIQGKLS